jgi:hypothetical protein
MNSSPCLHLGSLVQHSFVVKFLGFTYMCIGEKTFTILSSNFWLWVQALNSCGSLPQFFNRVFFIPIVMNPSNYLHINKWTFNSISPQSNNIYTSCNQRFYYLWIFTHWNFLTSYLTICCFFKMLNFKWHSMLFWNVQNICILQ